jgi:hypothetical protein
MKVRGEVEAEVEAGDCTNRKLLTFRRQNTSDLSCYRWGAQLVYQKYLIGAGIKLQSVCSFFKQQRGGGVVLPKIMLCSGFPIALRRSCMETMIIGHNVSNV